MGLLYQQTTGQQGAFLVLAALVVSHWALDFATHRPDVPLYPGGPKLGLGLWNSIPGTLAVELPMFAPGLWIYARATRARDAAGRWGFVSLAAFLTIVYMANAFGGRSAIGHDDRCRRCDRGSGAGPLGWWVDRHRSTT